MGDEQRSRPRSPGLPAELRDVNLDRTRFHPRYAVLANASPLQNPNSDPIVHTETVAGPDQPGERRMFLSVDTLASLLDVARASPMRRAVLHRIGVQINTHRSSYNGELYEVWTFVALPPAAEPIPRGLGG